MRRNRSFPRALLILTCLAAPCAATAADYPDYGAQAAPSSYPARGGNYEDVEPGRLPASEPVDYVPPPAGAAQYIPASEPEAPSRYADGAHASAAPARLVNDVADAPQPLPAAKRALLPARQNNEARGVWPGQLPPLVSAAASLGIVLGLFLLVVWVVRRGMPKAATLLPSDVVQLLGRAPLVGRQNVHLVRCGNKLLLLSLTATTATTLTEITDPAEVERLLDLCQPRAASTAFRQVLGRFTQQHGAAYFDQHESDAIDFGHLDAYGHEPARGSRV